MDDFHPINRRRFKLNTKWVSQDLNEKRVARASDKAKSHEREEKVCIEQTQVSNKTAGQKV